MHTPPKSQQEFVDYRHKQIFMAERILGRPLTPDEMGVVFHQRCCRVCRTTHSDQWTPCEKCRTVVVCSNPACHEGLDAFTLASATTEPFWRTWL